MEGPRNFSLYTERLTGAIILVAGLYLQSRRIAMKIEVCGSGCSKCAELEKRAKEAVALTGIDATVEHVYDMGKIIERGIFMTPALVIDGKTVASGKIPSVEEIASFLRR